MPVTEKPQWFSPTFGWTAMQLAASLLRIEDKSLLIRSYFNFGSTSWKDERKKQWNESSFVYNSEQEIMYTIIQKGFKSI